MTLEHALTAIPFYRAWKSMDPGPSVPASGSADDRLLSALREVTA